jgi:hypothetical protein
MNNPEKRATFGTRHKRKIKKKATTDSPPPQKQTLARTQVLTKGKYSLFLILGHPPCYSYNHVL